MKTINGQTLILKVLAVIFSLAFIGIKIHSTYFTLINNIRINRYELATYYIIEILSIVAFIVGILIGKYFISYIGLICYFAISMIFGLSQGPISLNTLNLNVVIGLLIQIGFITVIALLLAKFIKPMIALIIFGALSLLDLVEYIFSIIQISGRMVFALGIILAMIGIVLLFFIEAIMCLLEKEKQNDSTLAKPIEQNIEVEQPNDSFTAE